MKATLEDLQDEVNYGGLLDEYQNGSTQKGMKQSAALQAYNALVKNYTAVIKTLAGILQQTEPNKTATIGELMGALMDDE